MCFQRWHPKFVQRTVSGDATLRATGRGPTLPTAEPTAPATKRWVGLQLTQDQDPDQTSLRLSIVFLLQAAMTHFYLVMIGHALSLVSLLISLTIFFYFKWVFVPSSNLLGDFLTWQITTEQIIKAFWLACDAMLTASMLSSGVSAVRG